MRQILVLLLPAVLLVAGCSSPAPTASSPTTTSPTLAPSSSPAAKPASPVASPSAAAAASPAAKPSVAASPGASVVPSPSPAGPAVNGPLLFTGNPTPGFTLESSAFTDGGNLPSQFSCDGPGGGQSPPLSWSGAPSTTKTFVLVDQDVDGAAPNTVSHWVTYSIPPTVTQFEAAQPADPTLPNGALQGLNARRAIGYLGACPPAGTPAHHYTFQLFALDTPLTVAPGATVLDVQSAMTGHIVAQTKIVALFGH